MIILTTTVNFLICIDFFNIYFFSDELTFFFDGLVNPYYNLIHDFNGKYYRPIPILLMEILYLVFGNSPIPFRLISVIIHIFNLFLIYLIANELFKKKFSPFFTISIMMLLSSIYYEIFFWIATYFELIYVTFGLISIFYFLKYLKTGKLIDFVLSVFFVSLSFLSKESALFIIPLYGIFELTECQSIKLFLKTKSLKYIAFLPVIALFVYVRLATNRFFSTIRSYLGPLSLVLIIGGLIFLIPFYLWMKKTQDTTKKFIILFGLIYTLPLIFHRTSRIFYFSCFAYSLVLILLFFDKYDYKILNLFKHVNLRRMRDIFIIFSISGLILGTSIYLQYSKNIYKIMGTSMKNVSFEIAMLSPNSASKHIYILYLPCFGPNYFGFAEQEIRQALRLITFQDYDINTIYILDSDLKYIVFDFLSLLSPYQYYNSIGAEPKTVSIYNQLTQNSSNLMLLYSVDFLCAFNISGVIF